ncbi:MAG TPA: hypothetical protein DCS43_17110, partial [Verrucomicrobia bacterium]|nr:hypothetical protein [Verrucomicrobiota bacterium]
VQSLTFNYAYKVLLADGSMAIIDPSDVQLPVRMETEAVLIPLGTVRAIKFTMPANGDIPDHVFVRFASGHVYQMPWIGKKRDFSATSVSGSSLRFPLKDVRGIRPVVSDATSPTTERNTTTRIIKTDGSELSIKLPIQLWSFKTDTGRLSLPSTLVTSFTVPLKRGEKGLITTLYGEKYLGTPEFTSIHAPMPNNEANVIQLQDINTIEASSGGRLDVPEHAVTFLLKNGDIIRGIPYDMPISLLVAETGGAVSFGASSSLTAISDRTFQMQQAGIAQVAIVRPTSRSIDISLLISGERAKLNWNMVAEVRVGSAAAASAPFPTPASATAPAPAPAPALTTSGQPDPEPEALDTTETEPGETTFSRWRHPRPTEVTAVSSVPMDMPWGSMDLQTNQIAAVYPQTKDSAIVITTAGDVLQADLTSRRVRDGLQLVINLTNAMTNVLFTLPPPPENTAHITIRLVRGDIITGTFASNSIPFIPIERGDNRTEITAAELQNLQLAEGVLHYGLQRGTILGKPAKKTILLALSATQGPVEIPLTMIDSLVRGAAPLPPPSAFTPNRPAALAGEAHIEGGTFNQGSGATGMLDEAPRVQITLSSFIMDAAEVTRAQFAAFVEDSGYRTLAEETRSTVHWKTPGFPQTPEDPVVCTAWVDAAEFCNWRSKQARLQPVYSIKRDGTIITDRTANGYRLPTESEWEYAAGGQKNLTYPWGKAMPASGTALANYMQREGELDDGWRWTNPVHAFPPAANGVYGMAGNVWEWCEDWYFDRAYDALRNRSPLNPCIQLTDAAKLDRRVMRGGSFRNDPDFLRTASRSSGLPQAFAPYVGFRCVRNAQY